MALSVRSLWSVFGDGGLADELTVCSQWSGLNSHVDSDGKMRPLGFEVHVQVVQEVYSAKRLDGCYRRRASLSLGT